VSPNFTDIPPEPPAPSPSEFPAPAPAPADDATAPAAGVAAPPGAPRGPRARKPGTQGKRAYGCLIAFLVVGGLGILAVVLGFVVLAAAVGNVGSMQAANEYTETVLEGSGDDKIAVVAVEGVIMEMQASIFAKGNVVTRAVSQLRQASEDSDVKAVILIVDSPGGGVTASDIIYNEVVATKAAGKTVVVLMKDVAASGGYYISCPADLIMAHPTTITGSIGVIFQTFNVSGLMADFKIKTETVRALRIAGGRRAGHDDGRGQEGRPGADIRRLQGEGAWPRRRDRLLVGRGRTGEDAGRSEGGDSHSVHLDNEPAAGARRDEGRPAAGLCEGAGGGTGNPAAHVPLGAELLSTPMSADKSPPAAERITAQRARELAQQALRAGGMSEEDALAVADVLVEAELAGRAGHGLIRLAGLCKAAANTNAKAGRAKPEIVREGAAHALIDAKGQTGYLTASLAIDLACEKAAESGVAVVGVKNTTHAGFMGYYVRRAAGRRMIGALCAETFPRIAPTGSSEALLGTNPIAIAIPAEPDDIIIDLSTVSVTNGALLLMKSLGIALPAGLAFDAEGKATTDAAEALGGAVVPFGGPKGYCLALLVQVLSSGLLGMEVIPERGGAYGMLAAALDPEIFTMAGEFEASMSELRTRVKALAPEGNGGDGGGGGDGEVMLPGERAWRERAARLESGIDVSAELLRQIEGLASG